MPDATIQVSGLNADREAMGLHGRLGAELGSGEGVTPVEVERSAELVIASIGLVFSGVQAAKTIWDWWQSRQGTGMTVRILLDNGEQIDLTGVDQEQLELVLDRRTKETS